MRSSFHNVQICPLEETFKRVSIQMQQKKLLVLKPGTARAIQGDQLVLQRIDYLYMLIHLLILFPLTSGIREHELHLNLLSNGLNNTRYIYSRQGRIFENTFSFKYYWQVGRLSMNLHT